MNKYIIIAAFAAIAVPASAQLTINVTGVPGSGVTTWTFGGTTDTVALAGSIRDATANTFSAFDTGQFPFGENTVLNTSLQDVVLNLTGNASITIGSDTRLISGIYIDDDGSSADDMGVRALTQLDYLAGETSSWTGAGTVGVDINDFVAGLWSLNSTDGQATFFADPINITFTPVPEPATMVVLGGAALVALARKRRKA